MHRFAVVGEEGVEKWAEHTCPEHAPWNAIRSSGLGCSVSTGMMMGEFGVKKQD